MSDAAANASMSVNELNVSVRYVKSIIISSRLSVTGYVRKTSSVLY